MAKKTQTQSTIPNPIEALKSAPDAVGKAAQETAKDFTGDFFKQLFGDLLGASSKAPSESVIKKGTEQIKNLDPKTGAVELFNAKNHGKTESGKRTEKAPRQEAAINYHRDVLHNRERASRGEVRDMNDKVKQLTFEIQQLASSSAELRKNFFESSMNHAPAKVGEYHIHFLEWMILMIKSAREKVEDSNAWLNTVKGKGGKKGKGYWGMFKKHGTSFGMSNERAVATQAG